MKILEERKWTLATAESCTGGMVASRIVDYAGASKAFVNGMVTYTNESKSRLLGVKCDTLEKWGAVSSQTAEEMCLGVAKVSNTNVGISTTGVAGLVVELLKSQLVLCILVLPLMARLQ